MTNGMTLEKAIGIVSDSANRGITTHDQDFKDAQKLLIEAGQRIQRQRTNSVPYHQPPLPGEAI